MKILVSGSRGRMGTILKETIASSPHTLAAEVSPENNVSEERHTYASLDQVTVPVDVLIDFSSHLATSAIASYCSLHHVPAVIATTGQSEEEMQEIRCLAEDVPVFYSGNLSIGIAVLTDFIRQAAAVFPDADIEIVEKHHNQKLDVPSGTALMLANAVKEVRPDAVFNIGRHENGKRKKNEIGIHSLRMGNEVGTHEVYINTGNECLTLRHEAESRAVFADGALRAAAFLVQQKPGLYSMKELLNS